MNNSSVASVQSSDCASIYNFRLEAFKAFDNCVQWIMFNHTHFVGRNEQWEFWFMVSKTGWKVCILNDRFELMEELPPAVATHWYSLAKEKF